MKTHTKTYQLMKLYANVISEGRKPKTAAPAKIDDPFSFLLEKRPDLTHGVDLLMFLVTSGHDDRLEELVRLLTKPYDKMTMSTDDDDISQFSDLVDALDKLKWCVSFKDFKDIKEAKYVVVEKNHISIFELINRSHDACKALAMSEFVPSTNSLICREFAFVEDMDDEYYKRVIELAHSFGEMEENAEKVNMELILDTLACNESISIEIVKLLAKEPFIKVKASIINRKDLPEDIIRDLCTFDNFQNMSFIMSCADSKSALPPDIIKKVAAHALDGTKFRMLYRSDLTPEAAAICLQPSNIDEHVDFGYIRNYIVNTPMSEDVMWKISYSKCYFVRRCLAARTDLPEKLRIHLKGL